MNKEDISVGILYTCYKIVKRNTPNSNLQFLLAVRELFLVYISSPLVFGIVLG